MNYADVLLDYDGFIFVIKEKLPKKKNKHIMSHVGIF